MKDITSIFKALSDGNRFKITVALMEHEELCACQLTEFIGVSGATASRHLSLLASSGLVESRKEGRWVYYRLKKEDGELKDLFLWVRSMVIKDSSFSEEMKKLERIVSLEPEDLCRKQRGESCCPQK